MRLSKDNRTFAAGPEDNVKLFYDLETTGTNHLKHSIHSLAGIIEINNKVYQRFKFNLRPHIKAKIEDAALAVCKVTKEQIMAYPPYEEAYIGVLKILNGIVDQYNPASKITLVGYNNRAFDDQFFRYLFILCKNGYFGSYFYPDSHDAMVLASVYLQGERRRNMPNFKLNRVALELGLDVDEERLHDAEYDLELTRQVYRITTGLEIEI